MDPVSNLQFCSPRLGPVGLYPVSEGLVCSAVTCGSSLGPCHGIALLMLLPDSYNLFSPCREEQPYAMAAPDKRQT